MDTYTVLPFVVAFMAGLCAMPALNIFDIHAWNVGTVKTEPWRTRTSGIVRAVTAAFLRFVRLCRAQIVPIGAAVALALLVAHLATVYATPGILAALVVAATPRERREQREKLIRDAGATMGANNTFENDDKRSAFDGLMTDIETLTKACADDERAEKIATLARQQLPESQRQAPREGDAAATTELRDRAMDLYLRGVPMGDMDREERQALGTIYRPFSADEQRQVQAAASLESRDMSTLSAPAGGIVVAPDTRFYGSIIQAMKFFGGMEAVGSEVINTDTAGPLPIPMGDDTSNVGAIIAEAAASAHAGGTSPVLTSLVLGGYLYSSKVVKVSWQMIRDAAINVEGYVGGLLGERLARIQNTHFTTGLGASQPQGLVTVATVGRQSATGNATSVPFDDVYRTIHSVDIAYRTALAKWMFADTTALVFRLAKDGMGRYLWPEMGNVQAGQPSVLAGYPVVINNDMAAMAASAKYASFGDHRYYKIRRIKGITVVRINELYVESGQVGFLAFQSADGGFADAGQHPVKLLQNSAS